MFTLQGGLMSFAFINIHICTAPEAIQGLELPFDNDEMWMKLGKLCH